LTGPGPDGRPPAPDTGSAPPGQPDGFLAPDGSEGPTDPSGPPGGGIFTLEGRRAPGLYLAAWVLTIGGLVVTFVIGPMASSDTARNLLIVVGAVVVTLGFATAAGSQVLERRARPPERYRGPSPLLAFAAYFFAMSLVGLLLIIGFGVDPEDPSAFFLVGCLQAAGYALVVWLFAVRSGALSWRGMGWPARTRAALGRALRGVLSGMALMVPTTLALVILGGIVGLIVGVDAPRVLPLSSTALDGLFVVLTAAFIVPIGEELFFRGFALTAWARDLGERTALIRSAVFFAVVHIANITSTSLAEGLGQVVLTLVVILPIGFALGWLFLRRGMAGAIGGHVTYNSLLLILAFLASKIPDPA
jgi:membrane protease YdiL (CAAX protease family)